jgi:hypothetical protein
MEQYEKEVAAKGLPPHVVLDMSDGYNSVSEFGCESRILNGLSIRD